MHEVLVNRLGGLSLPRKSVVRLTDRPDMTLDVYRGRKTTMQQKQQQMLLCFMSVHDLLSVIQVYHTQLGSGVIRADLLLWSEKWVSKFQVQVQIQFQIHVYIFLIFFPSHGW